MRGHFVQTQIRIGMTRERVKAALDCLSVPLTQAELSAIAGERTASHDGLLQDSAYYSCTWMDANYAMHRRSDTIVAVHRVQQDGTGEQNAN